MDRMTRHQLKQDELLTAFEHYEAFIKRHYKEIVTVVVAAAVVSGAVFGFKLYSDRQETAANTQLAVALKTFRAYVGSASPEALGPDAQSFPTPQEKYKKALDQFSEVARKYPREQAGAIARYHMGVCQAALGDHTAAIKTLQEATRTRDRGVAALANLALAGELASQGKVSDAVKIYTNLAAHPTTTVPETTALLAEADAIRATQPAQARQIYERLQKQAGSNATLASALKEDLGSLPQ